MRTLYVGRCADCSLWFASIALGSCVSGATGSVSLHASLTVMTGFEFEPSPLPLCTGLLHTCTHLHQAKFWARSVDGARRHGQTTIHAVSQPVWRIHATTRPLQRVPASQPAVLSAFGAAERANSDAATQYALGLPDAAAGEISRLKRLWALWAPGLGRCRRGLAAKSTTTAPASILLLLLSTTHCSMHGRAIEQRAAAPHLLLCHMMPLLADHHGRQAASATAATATAPPPTSNSCRSSQRCPVCSGQGQHRSAPPPPSCTCLQAASGHSSHLLPAWSSVSPSTQQPPAAC